jgi:hypothetical protein
MKKTSVTFGQLDEVLRSLGFTCRLGDNDPPGYIYEHPMAGAMILLPSFAKADRIYEHHLAAARMELRDFGIADPATFDAKLHKAG